ncbi:MAG: protein kinase [Kofleriaceae bacterium]
MAIPRELGRYELLIELGRGGMAELFVGRLHGAGGFAKLVAIKRILPHLAQDKQFTEMFLNEGRIAAQLSHPNVCSVFELSEDAGELFLAMEYLEGVSWAELVAALPPGNVRVTVGVLAQAAEGLHYAHTLRDVLGRPTSIVHRDVSPQNLFVTVDGVCKVLDFGVSKMLTDGPRTRSGVVKGKLPYMAPEQLRAEELDGRADVFALGTCAWEALTGVRLFDRETDYLIWKAITEEPIPPITTYWPDCPPALEAVVRRALERDRELRQRSRASWPTSCARRWLARRSSVKSRPRCARMVASASRPPAGSRDRGQRAPRPSPADTIADPPDGVHMRDRSRRVVRPPHDADAAETTDLRAAGADAAATADLRAASRAPTDDALDRPPRRRLGLVIGGLAVVGLAIAALVLATRDRGPTTVARADTIDAGVTIDARVDAPAADVTIAPAAVRPAPKLAAKLATRRPAPTVAIPPGEPGYFSVDSRPYARIFVDGKELGDTALFQVPLPPGRHQIRAVLADGREQRFAIEVAPGKHVSSGRLTW